ncbi:4-hydroxybenzoate 3-monooxygenase [Roseivivax isoporae]|uniref:4-hydroxybenzoate 3-monooxygenase n=1 Tax=Roseivivax isoporae LMG 25204 TaxID=1449351 RepID=X7FC03_9RHOB|nr:4-hydroxybenzoate 3-monooxygenase [Roseivivax isoporae]ETX29549.1 4-hydroxybenzoate 3-monooxygenase [Roseivivax isoporae LMG 25204]
MRTQVAIIGGGPSGLLLSQLLNREGIATVVLERRSRAHVLSRIRAGVLERGSAALLRHAGVGGRMDAEGLPHDGCYLSTVQGMFHVSFRDMVNAQVLVYGQTEVTKDLYAAQDAIGATLIDGAEDVALHEVDGANPYVTYRKDGEQRRVACDVIAGCDGFHGISRQTIPASVRHEFERVYPFGWLGVLSETAPAAHELVYANHPRGFALASMRNARLSRYYIQVPEGTRPEQWSDAAFWDELRRRLPPELAESMETGPSIEKSVAPLRSFVCEPMRHGRLFLVGDAAHIVPPTGAKGLNLAFGDVHYLFEALRRWYRDADAEALDTYSDRALARVWGAMRFSWWMTNMLHRFPEQSDFDQRMQESELRQLVTVPSARTTMALNYVGLPY